MKICIMIVIKCKKRFIFYITVLFIILIWNRHFNQGKRKNSTSIKRNDTDLNNFNYSQIIEGNLDELSKSKRALVITGHLRMLKGDISDYWKWIVEKEDLDVYIFTHKYVHEKLEASTWELSKDYVRDIFKSHLKSLLMLEDHGLLVRHLENKLKKIVHIRAKLLSNEHERDIKEHYYQCRRCYAKCFFTFLAKDFLQMFNLINRYEAIIHTRTDMLFEMVRMQDDTLQTPNQLFPTYHKYCKLLEKITLHNLLVFSYLHEILEGVRRIIPAVGLGFSLSDYFSIWTPEGLVQEALKFNTYWQLYEKTPHKNMKSQMTCEGQYYLHRIAFTNIIDIRDTPIDFRSIVMRSKQCYYSKKNNHDIIKREELFQTIKNQWKRHLYAKHTLRQGLKNNAYRI